MWENQTVLRLKKKKKKSEDNGTKFGGKENETQEYYNQPNYSCRKTAGRHSQT